MGRPDPLDDDRKPVCPDCGTCTTFRLTGRRCDGCSDRFPEPAYAVPARNVDDRTHIPAAIEWGPEWGELRCAR